MNKAKGKSRITTFLGPVESLESYVRAEWWREIFNANYIRTDGDVVDDSKITSKETDSFISLTDLSKDDIILDLCCGQGRHSVELAARGFKNIYGLDRSHYLINRAKKQAAKDGYSINFREGDARKLPYSTDLFDCIIIPGNSFGYFESCDDDKKVLLEVFRTLKPGGKLLLDVSDGDYLKENFTPRSWEWIDKNYFVCRERSLSSDNERLVTREVITHVSKGVIADQFYAERLYNPEMISSMLKECGFKNIRIHEPIITESQRMQDLGMMARRLIITSSVEKEWSPKKKQANKKRSVIVIMGDPELEDKVKPLCKFDEDDFKTISQLKDALSCLKNYKFTYVNSHKNLMSYLIKNKNRFEFALNLCDEGFSNDPEKELHIPALLEMLDIEYSGGNPQCLSYCYDKSLVRGIAKELDIPVPKAFMINPEDSSFIEFPIHFPVIVKPNYGDSSVGITKDSICSDVNELQDAIINVRKISGPKKPILVEEFLNGKDISVGIIGNLPDEYTVLPVIEEDYSALPEDLPKVCGYEAKWDPKSPYWNLKSIKADLPEDVLRFLTASCIRLYARLGCRDYARFDWRLDKNGTPRLLEANPNPGWCWDGHLAKMAGFAGMNYQDMLKSIMISTEKRIFPDNEEIESEEIPEMNPKINSFPEELSL
jgi:D-alanine-D-alanine ligase